MSTVITRLHTPSSREPLNKIDANRAVPVHLTQMVIEAVKSFVPYSAKVEYLQQTFLSKFVGPETDSAADRRNAAIVKWLATEERNQETNERLLLVEEDYHILPHVPIGKFENRVRQIIRLLVGDSPPITQMRFGFSGGASTSRKRTESQPASKFLGKVHITAPAVPWFILALSATPGYGQYALSDFYEALEPQVVDGNVLFTVPKNTVIDRVAAKEPDLNMYLQRGVGNHIRAALRRVGIDLNDQTVNNGLARLGSLTGSLATLDLSAASDSVTTQLCCRLFSPSWFCYLMDIRSPFTSVDGEIHTNNMMSSMGNGFTFELQSLVYYAVMRAIQEFMKTPGILSVYGDDLIIQTELYNDVVWVLGFYGFSVNPEKSFAEGPFRESCGGHYHDGHDVTPFYLRKPIETIVDVIHVCNGLRRWADNGTSILDHQVEPLWLELAKFVPKSLWGGADLGSDQQLVCPSAPLMRLSPVKGKEHDFTAETGFMHWLCTTDGRSYGMIGFDTPNVAVVRMRYRGHGGPYECVSTSMPIETTERYRIRPVRKHTERFSGSEFLSEVTGLGVTGREPTS